MIQLSAVNPKPSDDVVHEVLPTPAVPTTVASSPEERSWASSVRRLWRQIFQVVFRMVPYPTRPRLIRIGNPTRNSPVLVTTNYDLTVRRVCRALQGLDCYLLVAPAGGLDVWCAAGGGRFNIESIISIIKTSCIGDLVNHRRLILPQLSATGINIFELKRRTNWTGVFGPLSAEDVGEYIRTRRKTPDITRVNFTVKERLEMATAMSASLSLRYTLFPCLLFGWFTAPSFIAIVCLLSVAVSLGCFVLPGKTFVQKAAVVGLIGSAALLTGLFFAGGLTTLVGLKWVVLFGFASFLAGTAFPSYSPYWPCGYSKLFYGSCDLELSIIEQQCIGCKICDNVCPVDCFSLSDERKMFFSNPQSCVGCGACLLQCPTDAIINEVAVDHIQQTACG